MTYLDRTNKSPFFFAFFWRYKKKRTSICPVEVYQPSKTDCKKPYQIFKKLCIFHTDFGFTLPYEFGETSHQNYAQNAGNFAVSIWSWHFCFRKKKEQILKAFFASAKNFRKKFFPWFCRNNLPFIAFVFQQFSQNNLFSRKTLCNALIFTKLLFEWPIF